MWVLVASAEGDFSAVVLAGVVQERVQPLSGKYAPARALRMVTRNAMLGAYLSVLVLVGRSPYEDVEVLPVVDACPAVVVPELSYCPHTVNARGGAPAR